MCYDYIDYGIIVISFVLYFGLSYISKSLKFRNLIDVLNNGNRIRLLNLKHFLGIIIFGAVPLTFYSTKLSFKISSSDSIWILIGSFAVASFLAAFIAYSSAKKIKLSPHDIRNDFSLEITGYFIIRVIFLISYEFFFRGVLLYLFVDEIGLWPAIIVITALYVIIHAFDTRAEIIGAIPFGIILCLFSYLGSLFMAVGLHLILSFTYELTVCKRFINLKEL